jgi:hypothetical protein
MLGYTLELPDVPLMQGQEGTQDIADPAKRMRMQCYNFNTYVAVKDVHEVMYTPSMATRAGTSGIFLLRSDDK